jgi:hypothetical protein
MNLIIDYQSFWGTKSVVIKLIDNPLVNDWIKNFKADEEWKVWHKQQCRVKTDGFDAERLDLIRVIDEFNSSMDFKFPFEIRDNIEFTRKDLNTIHRYFTTGSSFRSWTLDSEKLIETNSPLFETFQKRLSAINDAVHILDNYYDNGRKKQSTNVDILSFQPVSQDRLDYFQHQVGDWRYLDYDLEYDVFMNYAICGKDYFQAYIDDDDPRNWDITSQYSSYYNFFYIDVNGERNKVMSSHEFKLWLDNACLYNSAWQFMPIGKVISGTHGDISKFKGFRLE